MDALALLSQVATNEDSQGNYYSNEAEAPAESYPDLALDPALRTAGVKRKLSANALDEGVRDIPVPAFSHAFSPLESARALTSLSYDSAPVPTWQERLLSPMPIPIASKPEAQIYNETDGVIRCVCPYDDDDGFTIQCDRCFAWQHGLCVGISPDAVPDDYLCELCDPNPNRYLAVDRDRATEKQQMKRRAEEGLRRARESLVATSAAGRNIDDAQLQATAILMASDDSTSGQFELPPPVPAPSSAQAHKAAKRKSSNKSIGGAEDISQPLSTSQNNRKENTNPPKQRKKPGPKPKSQNQNQNQQQIPPASAPPATPATPVSALATPLELQGPPLTRRTTAAQQSVNTLNQSTNSAHAYQYSDDDGDEQLEAWQFEYTPVTEIQWADTESVETVQAALQNWMTMGLAAARPSKSEESHTEIQYEAVQRGKINWRQISVLREQKSDITDDGVDKEAGFFAEYDPDEDAALSAPIGPVEINHLPSTVKVAVKPIAQASFSLAPPLSQPFSTASTTAPSMSVPYPRASVHALFATQSVPAGSFIAPLYGEVGSIENYRGDPVSQYSILGISKPAVRTLSAPWSIVIDQRRYGNETRFARTGCHPNAVIRPVVYKSKSRSKTSTPDDDAAIEVAFALFALTDISKREEIVLPWDWDDHHIVHTLPSLLSLPSAEAENIDPTPWLSRKMAAVSMVLFGVTACACERRKDCALAWMWKLACASQPSGFGGNNRREIDEEGIVDRMVTALTGSAAGHSTNGKKNQKGKRPDLGPLVELRRGWVPEPVKTAPQDPSETSMEVDMVTGDVVKGKSLAGSPHPEFSSDEEEIVRPPKRRKNTNATDTLSRKENLPARADNSKLDNSLPKHTKESALALLPREEPMNRGLSDSTMAKAESHSALGLMFDEPSEMTVTQPLEPALVEPIKARSLTPIKEPTPPPAKPPSPPPPRTKLSLAAFRQRLATVKPSDEKEEKEVRPKPASMATTIQSQVAKPTSPAKTAEPPSPAAEQQPVSRSFSPPPASFNRLEDERFLNTSSRSEYAASRQINSYDQSGTSQQAWRSNESEPKAHYPPAPIYEETPKSAYFPPAAPQQQYRTAPHIARYDSPVYQRDSEQSSQYVSPLRPRSPSPQFIPRGYRLDSPEPPLSGRSPRSPRFRQEDRFHLARAQSPNSPRFDTPPQDQRSPSFDMRSPQSALETSGQFPPRYGFNENPVSPRYEPSSPRANGAYSPSSPRARHDEWSAQNRDYRRGVSPSRDNYANPGSPTFSESSRGRARAIPTGPSAFGSVDRGASRGGYRGSRANFRGGKAVYTRPVDPIDAPRGPKFAQPLPPRESAPPSRERDRTSWPPRDNRNTPRDMPPAAPSSYRHDRPPPFNPGPLPTGPSSRGRGWAPRGQYRGRGRGFRGGY